MSDNWHTKAACAKMPTDLFFQHSKQGEAIGVCLGCPVIKHCFDYAMDRELKTRSHHLRAGIFGATRPSVRAQIARLVKSNGACADSLFELYLSNGDVFKTIHLDASPA